MSRNSKIEIGDVFEIQTKKGFAYIQCRFFHPKWLELVRVLPGLYKKRPEDFAQLVGQPDLYEVFFMLKASYRDGMVKKVAHFDVDGFKPEYMRNSIIIRNVFYGWNIVNTDNLHRKHVLMLNNEESKLSPFGIWNPALLIQRLEEGWNLENWQERIEKKFGPPVEPKEGQVLI